HGERQEPERVRKALEEELGRRPTIANGISEVSTQRSGKKDVELLVDGPVEPEGAHEMRAVLLGGVLAQEEICGIPAHTGQADDDWGEDEELQNASEEERECGARIWAGSRDIVAG